MGRPAFHPGGHWLAAAPDYRSVSFWPVGLPRARVLTGQTQPVMHLRFTPDARRLLSCSREGLRIWPLVPGEGGRERVAMPPLPQSYLCYGVDVDSKGENAALTAAVQGLFVVPLSSRKPRLVLPSTPERVLVGAAFDVTGRQLVAFDFTMTDSAEVILHVVDTVSGAVRALPSRARRPGALPPGSSFGFAWDGRLLSAGEDGIYRWDFASGKPTIEHATPGKDAVICTTPDGRWLTALVADTPVNPTQPRRDVQLLVFDLVRGTHWSVTSHGSELALAVLDPSGSRLVTADFAGLVRVGPATGGEPHVLAGHTTGVGAVAISPDGRWIASGAGAEIRLWPMPDVTKPPLHTLPHDALMTKLRALTNLRVVDDDKASATGYRLEVGPFPGWKDAPGW